MTIQAVVFDFGGVLATDHFVQARLADFDRILGWQAGSLYLRLYSGPAWEAVSTGGISIDEYWAAVGEPVAARLPADFGHYRDNFFGETLDSDMVMLAHSLQLCYKLALVSNATPMLAHRLTEEPALAGLFDAVVISAQVGARKPDPGIFAIACQRLQLPPSACVLIDDRPRNIAAARAEGWHGIRHQSPQSTLDALKTLGVQCTPA